MIGKPWVGLFALGVVSASSRADACVTFYEGVNYGGASMSAGEESKDWVGDEWKDRISSLRLDPGCAVEVFENAGFDGATWIFSHSADSLGEWNDRISSYVCLCD
ncbi:peptidase inhibitor family I36 protein [Polyangium jinanense]|uniref:Peptidase inhibitor family I36 protein n=1 Tax=Polyangium jinanense TaxID=2829994 RepID=A0A9X4AZP0_9BACT|nr:peptidase inhibitor family I36 protein [Polyangium jinanense]MDC3985904.1 peptidase inhibitor family I36 protein [Polyangium jinanense]MDC3988520.1 peptidase inhibitor family I36 protein [Polyangium jinanense]